MLLQFSTSHYCRKARLALGYKQIDYQVENLNPGLHILKLKPLTGVTTVPVLLPQESVQPAAIADSTRILNYLETYCPEPKLILPNHELQTTAWMLEDWLVESMLLPGRNYQSAGKRVLIWLAIASVLRILPLPPCLVLWL